MIHINYTFSALVQSFLDSFVASDAIGDYCMTNFNCLPKFALGNDERREWGIDDAPFIVIIPSSFNGGITTSTVSLSFDIDIGISDSVFEDYKDESVTVMRGFRKLDGLVNVVMNEIETHASTYNAIGDQITCLYNNSEFFPLHIATLSVDVEVPAVMNGKNTLGG